MFISSHDRGCNQVMLTKQKFTLMIISNMLSKTVNYTINFHYIDTGIIYLEN